MENNSEGRDEYPDSPEMAKGALRQQLDWSHRRIRDLLDEARNLRAEKNKFQARTKQLDAEKQRLAKLLVRAEKLVQSMEAGIHAMRHSISMQLGYLLTSSMRSLGGFVRLPYRLLIFLRAWALNRRGAPGNARQLIKVPVPQEWFPTSLRRELGRLHSDIAGIAKEAAVRDGGSHGGALMRSERLPDHLSDFRVAAIMDEFTFSAYQECCEVLQLTPEAWKGEVQEFRPHVLFIESAWDGKNRAWQRKVSGTARELRELADYCRRNGIPIVFWSKEDPVHFKTFLETARIADVVFTTDIDCVPHYKAELGHERVYPLPFATQPLSHNPIERYQRKHGFCFAGSYYVRYPIRKKDFSSLIDAAKAMGDVDIYDRNHGKEHPNFVFPDEYHPYILGGLSFDQIDLAYKGYDFGININTVKNSQSMFARRVFDLLASNTTVVSNYSRALKLMFGDLVVSSDDSAQLVKRLKPLVEDEKCRRKHRLAGLRKVLREHTYQHRLSYVINKTFGQVPSARDPLVTVLAIVGSDVERDVVLAAYKRQSWSRKELLLCFKDGYVPAVSPVGKGVRVLSLAQSKARMVGRAGDGEWVAAFHPGDYYGPNYLMDLALAVSFSRDAVVGKAAYFAAGTSGMVLREEGAQYREGVRVASRRALVPAAVLPEKTVYSWLTDLDEGSHEGNVLSIDEFNYCEGAGDLPGCEEVDDLQHLDIGISLDEMLGCIERPRSSTPVGKGGARDESSGLPGIEADAILRGLSAISNSQIAVEKSPEGLVFRSSLASGKHAYIYLEEDFSPAQMQFSDVGRMQLVCDRGEALDLVLIYNDEQGDKISHSILRAGVNITVSVPPEARSVKIGLRIRAVGDIVVRRLVFEHVPLPVEAFVSRGRHLLLAKNYPSYEDLYKHAFVHRRVVAYQQHGMQVDVFRIGNSGLTYYEFDGVDVAYGQADHLRAMLSSGQYDSILVHFLDERMWEVLQEFVDSTRIYVWAHGAEIQSASRREFDQVNAEDKRRAIALGDRRMRFWKKIFAESHPNLKMVFVSQWFADDVFEDVGIELSRDRYEVIHNFIDADLFRFYEKPASQRNYILSIRPFESAKYANDLSVGAVLALRDKPYFSEMKFLFVGDGRLFDEVMAPLAGLANVEIRKGFLSQEEIALLHREYGVFLNPTRMDAQGVSRDEAMASGLVPISNRVAAVPEFMDDSCGFLADAEDALGLAAAIDTLHANPALFETLSRAAAERVRRQSAFEASIIREIDMILGEGGHCGVVARALPACGQQDGSK